MKKIILLATAVLAPWALKAQAPQISWQKSYGGSGHDGLEAMAATTDGGYIIAGYTDSADGDITQPLAGSQDIWILKTDANCNIQWQKTIGGTASEMPHDIKATPDGGYIVAGHHNNPNSSNWYDWLIIKLDGQGNTQWQKILGGTGIDIAHGIQPTPDGGYIVAGESSSADGDAIAGIGLTDFWVVKINSTGTMQWQKKLGGTLNDVCWSIQLTPDGGYALAGVSESDDGDVTLNHGMNDYWLVKLDGNGNKLWQKCYGGTSIDYGTVMVATPDGGFLLSGFAFSSDGNITGAHGAGDMWIVKTDGIGNLQWQTCLGGTNNEVAYDVIATADGGYLLGGYGMSADGNLTVNQGAPDYWVVKITGAGVLEWQKSLGGSNQEYIMALQPAADGGYIVAGNSLSADGDVTANLGNEDFWLVKLGAPTSGTAAFAAAPVHLYPNPVKDTLHFKELYNSITVYTPDGKKLLEAANAQYINVSTLATGTYFLKTEGQGHKTLSAKFIKQ